MAKEKFGVKCEKHGMMDSKKGWRVVFVSRPITKKQRLHGGCPVCKVLGVT